MNKPLRILGIDPGSRITGFGIHIGRVMLRAARELGLPSEDWPVAPSYIRGVWG